MRSGTHAACGAAVKLAATLLLFTTGCASEVAEEWIVRVHESDAHLSVHITVTVMPLSSGDIVECEVSLKNVGRDPLVVFDDTALPTVLFRRGGTAEVYYGLTSQPSYRTWPTGEGFGWRALKPGEDIVRYRALRNPLEEKSYYGNQAYEDPSSEHFGKKPKKLTWRTLIVRVAYFVFQEGIPEQFYSAQYLSEGDVWNDTTLIELQQKITLRCKPYPLSSMSSGDAILN